MRTGNVDDLNAPKSMQNIVQEVMGYVIDHRVPAIERQFEYPIQFEIYDQALHAVWPELHKASPKAHLLVSVSIYIEIAERWGFSDHVPEELKGLRL